MIIAKETTEKSKKLRPTKYARFGEAVLIVTPKVFIRCGYRLSYQVLLEKRESHLNSQAYRMAKAVGLNTQDRAVMGLLKKAVAFDILKKENWGGRDRIIEEEPHNSKNLFYSLRGGDTVKVVDKKIVYTGQRREGWTSSDYWTGEVDGQLPTLEDRKSHVVYRIEHNGKWILAKNTIRMCDIQPLIDECNEKWKKIEEVSRKLERVVGWN